MISETNHDLAENRVW